MLKPSLLASAQPAGWIRTPPIRESQGDSN